jgi:hypothetical protein
LLLAARPVKTYEEPLLQAVNTVDTIKISKTSLMVSLRLKVIFFTILRRKSIKKSILSRLKIYQTIKEDQQLAVHNLPIIT